MRTKFFTGKGDTGKSKIGKRIFSKADFLFEVLGGLDELNSWLGFCRVKAGKRNSALLKEIQNSLFIIQAEIAAIGFGIKENKIKISKEKNYFLEKNIEKLINKYRCSKNS